MKNNNRQQPLICQCNISICRAQKGLIVLIKQSEGNVYDWISEIILMGTFDTHYSL